MSTQTQPLPPLNASPERRFYSRIAPQTPIFIAFRENAPEETLLLNISENGLLVSTPACVTSNFVARLALPLRGLPKPLQVTARVVWANESQCLAGIQLLELSEHNRQQIRKWGALESTLSPAPSARDSLFVDPPFLASAEPVPEAAFEQGATLDTPKEIVAIARTQTIQTRRSQILTRRALRIAFLATACLAAVVLLVRAAPGNPFAHFRGILPANTASATMAVDVLATPAPVTSAAKSNSPGATLSPTPSPRPSKPKVATAPTLAPPESQHMEQAAADDDPPNSSADAAQEERGDPPVESAAPTKPATDAAVAAVTPTSPTTVVSTPRTLSPSLSPMPPADLPPANPAPSASIPVARPTPAPPRPALSPHPASPAAQPVIQMDAPPTQTLQVHLPSGYQSPFFNLPGENVLESPAVTTHIQRSVHMPATHAGWPFNRNKKVVVGELISRVDPPPAQISSGSDTSVRVRATIAKDGHVASVNQILGPPNLVSAVAKALHEWRYQPTLVDGNPVETQCYVVFQFHTPQYRAAKRQVRPTQQ